MGVGSKTKRKIRRKRPITETNKAKSGETVVTRISEDIVPFREIIPSLKQYLTDATRAKELYIREDLFRTQFVEFLLDWLSGSGPHM